MSSSGTSLSGSAPSEQRWRVYLEAIRTGDTASLEALYDETSRILYGLACRILNDRAGAEEVVLDVYHQVWNSARHYDSARGSVWSWLTVMTRNRAIDRLRKSTARRTLEFLDQPRDVPSEVPPPESQTIFAQERKLVLQAISKLPQEQRRAIELAFFSGLSHSEIAATLGAPLGTIKAGIRVGMQKLRQALPSGVLALKV